MAITYPLALPTTKASSRIVFEAVNAVALTESPFTFQQQIQVHQGERWEARVSLPVMERADAAEWIAFLLALRGLEGTFHLGDPDGKTARGSLGGTPLVKGASQSGRTLITDGWPPSTTGVLLKGDYIELGTGANRRLYKVAGRLQLGWWRQYHSDHLSTAARIAGRQCGDHGGQHPGHLPPGGKPDGLGSEHGQEIRVRVCSHRGHLKFKL